MRVVPPCGPEQVQSGEPSRGLATGAGDARQDGLPTPWKNLPDRRPIEATPVDPRNPIDRSAHPERHGSRAGHPSTAIQWKSPSPVTQQAQRRPQARQATCSGDSYQRRNPATAPMVIGGTSPQGAASQRGRSPRSSRESIAPSLRGHPSGEGLQGMRDVSPNSGNGWPGVAAGRPTWRHSASKIRPAAARSPARREGLATWPCTK